MKIFEEFLSEEDGKAEKELDNFLNETHAPDGKYFGSILYKV